MAEASKVPTTSSEKLEEVISLINEGKEDEVNEILRNEKGLLHEACATGSVDAVTLLLDRNVPLSDWNKSYLLPLHLAAKHNHLPVAKFLLSRDPEMIDRPSKFGETPLHFACMKGHLSMVKLLIDHKADVRIDDRCGNTTLHYAVSSNNPELVEFLLRDKDLVEIINKRNNFYHYPIHRAAILQCVEVIQVLISYRVKLSTKDKNGLTAYDLATILYNNERVEVTDKGVETREPIIKENMAKYFPSALSKEQHFRSSSFSYHRGSYQIGMDGSTVSLPVSAGVTRKKPSATQAKRPVNLSFSNSYSRQASSGGSSQGSRASSDIYLKDKEQAVRLSQYLDKQISTDELQKIVLNQTAYEAPIDMFFIPPVESFLIHKDETRYHSKDHDIRLKIHEKYWLIDPNETLDCKLAASLHWNHAYPPNYIFVSPICFFSCKTKRCCEIKLTLPHALHFPSEKHYRRIVIFSATTVNLAGESGPTSPSGREFCRVQTSDLTVDPHCVTFSTSLKFPTLFAVGVASAPQAPKSAIPYPLLPLRCCLYVARPSDRDQYLTNTDIWVYIAMSLKTVEMAMQKHVMPHDFTLEEKGFVFSGQVLKISGSSETTEWEVSKRGTGLFRYNQVALSQETDQELSSMSHYQSYPLREAFFVECHDPSKTLKCRINVECDGKELVTMLLTPYIPIKVTIPLGLNSIREISGSPQDISSSTESIPMRTSSV